MSVKLVSSVNGNYFAGKTRRGELFVTTIELDNKTQTFDVRYEHGWYCEYREDGTRISGGVIQHREGGYTNVPPNHDRDIVEYEIIDGNDVNSYLERGYSWGLHP